MISLNQPKNLAVKIRTDEIYCKAVNIEKMKKNISSFPHELHNDLAVLYYFQEKDNNNITTVTITYDILELLGISEDELKNIAWHNTLLKKNAVLVPLNEVLNLDNNDKTDIYILTNEEMRLGAVTAFYPLLLDMISEEFNTDICIIPSSIHECLLLPIKESFDVKNIRSIIKEINETYVSEDEILSYNIFRYERESKSIIIDNS